MEIISVKEKEFKEYGKVIEGLDVAQLLQEMQKTRCRTMSFMNRLMHPLKRLRCVKF